MVDQNLEVVKVSVSYLQQQLDFLAGMANKIGETETSHAIKEAMFGFGRNFCFYANCSGVIRQNLATVGEKPQKTKT